MRSVVIGAGPAGLIATRDLLARGDAVTVLEAGDRVGGRVSSLDLDGLTLDAGAESFATRGGAVATLCAELGLAVVPPTTNPAWVVAPGRAYPLPATGWLGIPVRPLDRDVRRIIGPSAAVHASLEPRRPLGDIPQDVTVGALVRSRLGDEVADLLVAPVLQGVYSRHVDALPLADIDASLPAQLREAGSLLRLAGAKRALSPAGSAVLGVEGGMWRLTEALAAAVRAGGGTIVTAAAAESLALEDGAWHIRAGGGRVVADRVVVTTPDAGLLVPGMPPGERRKVAVVTLVLDAPQLDGAPRGTGVLAVGAVTRAKALTHATAKWPWLARAAGGRHVVRLSYALEDAAEPVAESAVGDAARLLGVDLEPRAVRGVATSVWTDAAPARVEDLTPAPGLFLAGSAAGLSGLANIAAARPAWH